MCKMKNLLLVVTLGLLIVSASATVVGADPVKQIVGGAQCQPMLEGEGMAYVGGFARNQGGISCEVAPCTSVICPLVRQVPIKSSLAWDLLSVTVADYNTSGQCGCTLKALDADNNEVYVNQQTTSAWFTGKKTFSYSISKSLDYKTVYLQCGFTEDTGLLYYEWTENFRFIIKN